MKHWKNNHAHIHKHTVATLLPEAVKALGRAEDRRCVRLPLCFFVRRGG